MTVEYRRPLVIVVLIEVVEIREQPFDKSEKDTTKYSCLFRFFIDEVLLLEQKEMVKIKYTISLPEKFYETEVGVVLGNKSMQMITQRASATRGDCVWRLSGRL